MIEILFELIFHFALALLRRLSRPLGSKSKVRRTSERLATRRDERFHKRRF